MTRIRGPGRRCDHSAYRPSPRIAPASNCFTGNLLCVRAAGLEAEPRRRVLLLTPSPTRIIASGGGAMQATANPTSTAPVHTILYVDHSAGNRLVFQLAFDSRFKVVTAASCATALEILQHRRIGLVITEQRMPTMSGLELLEQVRSEYPGVARLMVAAVDLPEAVDTGLALRCVQKPWDNKEMEDVLQAALAAPDPRPPGRLPKSERDVYRTASRRGGNMNLTAEQRQYLINTMRGLRSAANTALRRFQSMGSDLNRLKWLGAEQRLRIVEGLTAGLLEAEPVCCAVASASPARACAT
ncbi:response regulator [Myxococcota bacterium]